MGLLGSLFALPALPALAGQTGAASAFGPRPVFQQQGEQASGAAADTTAPAAANEGLRDPEQVVVHLSPKKPGYFDAPGWVMARTAVIPGWGQLHNGSWLKALLIGGGEVWLGLRVWDKQKEIDDLALAVDAARESGDFELEEALIEQHNLKLDELVARQWVLGAMIGYALLDAYIDAHFRDFDIGFEGDPALPPASGGGGKLFLRWRF